MSGDVSRVTDFSSEKLAAQIQQRKDGRRKLVRHGGTLCSKCLINPPSSGGYCPRCHADYEAQRRRAEREELKRLRAEHGRESGA